MTALIEADDALARRVAALEDAIAFPLRTAYCPADERRGNSPVPRGSLRRLPGAVPDPPLAAAPDPRSGPLPPPRVRHRRETGRDADPPRPLDHPRTQVRELQGGLTNATEYREMPFKVSSSPVTSWPSRRLSRERHRRVLHLRALRRHVQENAQRRGSHAEAESCGRLRRWPMAQAVICDPGFREIMAWAEVNAPERYASRRRPHRRRPPR